MLRAQSGVTFGTTEFAGWGSAMQVMKDSVVTLLVYADMPQLNFLRVVSAVDRRLDGKFAGLFRLALESDTTAFFDHGPHRVLVGLSESCIDEGASCLALAIGPNPDPALHRRPSLAGIDFPGLCAGLVQEVLSIHPTASLLCQRSDLPLDTEFPDALFGPPEGQPEPAALPSAEILPFPARPRVKAPTPLTTRLTAQAFNCSVLAVSMPVGVALMAHSFLKGEDLRLSARAMALTGTAVAFLQGSGLGHYLPGL